ncbi:uncharacterized protein Ga0609869_000163 [Rhodovulum iodosum]|uniref:Beta-lactamase hydrolase-like protein phosphatase-like domain-containing protein n=1 Tax=Rhodovulum iodosum TaxID=68291 RepID=A0ABV3XNC0_9RHOB|nr:TIGR01244 family sulfur transferase [Rhodovulum robiginosum]RSK34716.1 TIGR01244 family phosphatase [Rhodovulum robiginosum]
MAQYRWLTPDFATAEQLGPADMAELAEAGIRTVLCNRPEDEVPIELRAEALAEHARAAGLGFHKVEMPPFGLTGEVVAQEARLLAETPGPHLAYCTSGTRSALMWAFAMVGPMTPEAIAAALAEGGFGFAGIEDQLTAYARQKEAGTD